MRLQTSMSSIIWKMSKRNNDFDIVFKCDGGDVAAHKFYMAAHSNFLR